MTSEFNGLLCSASGRGMTVAWLDFSWFAAVELVLSSCESECLVHIESIDGTNNPIRNQQIVEELVGPVSWMGPALVPVATFQKWNWATEELFPPYSAVWFVSSLPESFQPAPFISFYAGDDPAGLPRPVDSKATLMNWDKVSEWMVANNVHVGVSFAHRTLLVQRLGGGSKY